jgi:hypothetical protein
MNAPEISEDGIMPLRKQLTLMCKSPEIRSNVYIRLTLLEVGISAAVIFVSLSLAFSTWTRTIITVPLSLLYAQVTDRLGWRNRTSAYNSTTLKSIQRERLKQLDSRAMARRLTEISSRARDMSPFHHHHNQPHREGRSEEEMQQKSPTWTLGKFSAKNGVFRSKRLEEDPGSV